MQRKDESAEQIESLQRELTGTQEMLGFVLKSIGEPVVVTKEMIANGLGTETQIVIDDDVQKEAFVFYLKEAE